MWLRGGLQGLNDGEMERKEKEGCKGKEVLQLGRKVASRERDVL